VECKHCIQTIPSAQGRKMRNCANVKKGNVIQEIRSVTFDHGTDSDFKSGLFVLKVRQQHRSPKISRFFLVFWDLIAGSG
jgi:putative heme iron utilization protein